jgi:ribosomal protein S18 acetylase RimI-like enzyme
VRPPRTQSSSNADVSAPFTIELLSLQHKREAFTCGVEALDRYLRHQVSQDVRRRATACYVARELATNAIAGYYTLAAGSVLLSGLPLALAKKLPRYPDVPVARLGRLAVDAKFRGRKLGAALLWDAIERAARSEVVVYGVVVDAKDDEAAGFYEHHGFFKLSAEARQLILPLTNLRESKK